MFTGLHKLKRVPKPNLFTAWLLVGAAEEGIRKQLARWNGQIAGTWQGNAG